MFHLNYKLFAQTEEKVQGTTGYFQLTSNQFKYGLYLENELELLSVSVYQWFQHLLEVATLLKEQPHVYIRDVEKTGTMIEFKKLDYDVISICEVQATTSPEQQIVHCDEVIGGVYPDGSNNFVPLKVFTDELLEKTQGYLHQLKRLNRYNDPAILSLEAMIVELEVLQLS